MSTLYITGSTSIASGLSKPASGLNNVVTDSGHTFSSTNGFTVPAGTYVISTHTKWNSGSSLRLCNQGCYNGSRYIVGGGQWPGYRATDSTITCTSVFIVTVAASTTFGPAFITDGTTSLASGNNTTFSITEVSGITLVSDDDTGTGTDTATASLAGTQSDTGVGVDATGIRVTPLSDTGTGTDAATGRLAGTQADTAAAADVATGNLAGTRTDTATSADTAGVRVAHGDAGAGTDTAGIAQGQADAAAGADLATSVAAAPPSDPATGTESAGVGIAGADAGVATESATVTVAGSDLGSGADDAFVSAAGGDIITSDSANGADDAAVDAELFGIDSGIGADTASIRNTGIVDASAGLDAASVRVSGVSDSVSTAEATGILAGVPASDTGTASEHAWVVVHVAEAAASADTTTLAIPQTDSGSSTDLAGVPDSILSLSDTAAAVDEAFISVYGSDTSSTVEAQARNISGALVGVPRTFWVDPESRTTAVARETRTLTAGPESRLTMIGRENRTLKQYAEGRTVSIES